MDNEQLGENVFKAYRSGYEDPRSMHYTQIASEWGNHEGGIVGDIQTTDMLADAFDLGCTHSQNDIEPFETKGELLEEIASW